MSVSLLVGAPVTEKEGDVIINRMLEVLRAQQDPFADPFAEREAEIAIINRMLEVLKAEKKRLDEQANNEMNKRLAELRAGIESNEWRIPKVIKSRNYRDRRKADR